MLAGSVDAWAGSGRGWVCERELACEFRPRAGRTRAQDAIQRPLRRPRCCRTAQVQREWEAGGPVSPVSCLSGCPSVCRAWPCLPLAIATTTGQPPSPPHTYSLSRHTLSLTHTHTPTHPIALLTHLARPSHHLDTRPPAAPACHPSHAPTPVIARLRTAVGRRRSAYCATPASAPAPAPATALPRPRLLSTSWARDQP